MKAQSFLGCIMLAGIMLTSAARLHASQASVKQDSKQELGEELLDAIVRAAKFGKVEEVSKLIARGAPVNARRDDGTTALMLAARHNLKLITNMLLKAGADVNEVDTGNVTALMMASMDGSTNIITTLLNAGANPYIEDHSHKTAFYYAQKFPKAHQALEEYDAALQEKTESRWDEE